MEVFSPQSVNRSFFEVVEQKSYVKCRNSERKNAAVTTVRQSRTAIEKWMMILLNGTLKTCN